MLLGSKTCPQNHDGGPGCNPECGRFCGKEHLSEENAEKLDMVQCVGINGVYHWSSILRMHGTVSTFI